ncbi:MAG: cytochrome c maturation protein CcmE [Proteobacteria bacterium]|nr:cytochrome c maturation protein CcmE [Pseudomonadota bacterium]
MSKGAQIAVGAGAIALLLVWFAVTNLGSDGAYRYYQTLAEFQAAGDEVLGESLRVHGYVAAESIQRDVPGKRVHFAVQNDPPHRAGAAGPTLKVVYESLETPDLFKDGAEVVVEGQMERRDAEAVFVAHNVLAKCPSKFEAEKPDSAEL